MYSDRFLVAGMEGNAAHGGVGEAIRVEYAGPRGGTIVIRSLTAQGVGTTTPCRRTCTIDRYGHGDLVEVRAVAGRRVRFRRWADSSARSTIRRFRVGTHNPVRAIFARR
jgi:hypothetical protein